MPFEHTDSAFGIVTAAGPSVVSGAAEKMPLGPLVLSGPPGVPLRTCRAGLTRDFNLFLRSSYLQTHFLTCENKKKKQTLLFHNWKYYVYFIEEN